MSDVAHVRAPRRQRFVGALVLAGAAAVSVAAWVLATRQTGAEDSHRSLGHDATSAPGPPVATLPVGRPRRASVTDGPGSVQLDVSAEVEGSSPPLASIPAGVPVTLTFTLNETVDMKGQREPTLSASALGPKGASATPVSLAQPELLLFDRASGVVSAPAAATSGHDAGHTPPGLQLAQSSLRGGAMSWALTAVPEAGPAELSPDGRWLAAASSTTGSMGVVDVLRREPAGRITTNGHPATVRFSADGRLWAIDADGGHVRVFEMAPLRPAAELPLGPGTHAVAFDPDSRRGLITSSGADDAILVDLETLQVAGTVRVGTGATGVVFATDSRTFAVTHDGGRIDLVPLDDRGAPGPIRTIALDGAPALSEPVLGVDDRTIATMDRDSRRLIVLDTTAASVRATIPLEGDPAELDVLGRFALVRDATRPELTWVDLRDPSKTATISLGQGPASAVNVTADGTEALVVAPGDRWVFHVHVMMGRPMVMRQTPNGIAAGWAGVTGGGLQRTDDGRYVQRTVFTSPGRHRVTIQLPEGGSASFPLRVVAPARPAVTADRRTAVARVGEPVEMRFTIRGADPSSVGVLAYSRGADGTIRQVREQARRLGPGRYSATLVLPASGRYRVSLTSEETHLPGSPAVEVQVLPARR